MIYVDTSAIIKLYIKEPGSVQVSEWLKKNNEPIPLTGLIELELINGLKLKQFRNELKTDEFEKIITLIAEHEKAGIFYRPTINWQNVFFFSFNLSKTHTHDYGTRSLDILHVGSALVIKTDTFLTNDTRQAQLAKKAGLKTINFTSVSK
ncbi:MAG: type II toxin-antitoxin system VapC family toxin [Deltaproteobacteria bacterium]|nr:type II toxin-antitoxin system VapC family toxin [Deltaproteobacteria bacterium]